MSPLHHCEAVCEYTALFFDGRAAEESQERLRQV